jgi:hypothetical protein
MNRDSVTQGSETPCDTYQQEAMTKRPDQHNIDPSENASMDYKDFPQTGRGNAGNLDDTDIDKQKLASEKENQAEPIPGDRPQPSQAVNDALERQRKQKAEGSDDA